MLAILCERRHSKECPRMEGVDCDRSSGIALFRPFHERVRAHHIEGKRLPRYLFCARRLSRYYAQRVKGPEDHPSFEDTQTLGFSNYIPGLGDDMPFYVV